MDALFPPDAYGDDPQRPPAEVEAGPFGVTSVRWADGDCPETTTFTYDAEGRVLERRDQCPNDDRAVVVTYDQAGRVASRWDGLGVLGFSPDESADYVEEGRTYDDVGQVRETTRETQTLEGYQWHVHSSRCAFDAEGRIVGEAYSDNEDVGNENQYSSPPWTSRDEWWAYDPAGRVAAHMWDVEGGSCDAGAEWDCGLDGWGYEYDGCGRVVGVSACGLRPDLVMCAEWATLPDATRYAYDDQGYVAVVDTLGHRECYGAEACEHACHGGR